MKFADYTGTILLPYLEIIIEEVGIPSDVTLIESSTTTLTIGWSVSAF